MLKVLLWQKTFRGEKEREREREETNKGNRKKESVKKERGLRKKWRRNKDRSKSSINPERKKIILKK